MVKLNYSEKERFKDN